jgi:hypothetical protein
MLRKIMFNAFLPYFKTSLEISHYSSGYKHAANCIILK